MQFQEMLHTLYTLSLPTAIYSIFYVMKSYICKKLYYNEKLRILDLLINNKTHVSNQKYNTRYSISLHRVVCHRTDDIKNKHSMLIFKFS